MLLSFQRLARNMTDQLLSQGRRAGVNSTIGSSFQFKKQAFTNGCPQDTSYENAMRALNNLQSNAETIAKARQNHDKKVVHNIPNMNRYILRSGLTDEDVDKLSVIHVSGTKGKGSTCALCERVLYFHGYKTGLFTSPHLVEARERIRINGRPISQELFSKYFWKVYNNLQMTKTEVAVGAEDGGGMPPYFAFLTVLSLHVFLTEGVDVAVVEVGIGGQYDSTNFFRKPDVCGVTSLGLDHTALLGNTIEEIAWNKAGIFKPGRPAITVQHEKAAMEVLFKRACEIQTPLFIAKEMSEEEIRRQNIKLGIAGSKQAENASLAIQLYRTWKQVHTTGRDFTEYIPTTSSSLEGIPQLEVSEIDNATLKGLSSCVWPGRAQEIHRGDITYYLDGAHTKESIEVCVKWFKEAADAEMQCQSGKKFARILIFNATGDRDVVPLFTCLRECNFDAAVFCTNLLSTMESLNRTDQMNRTVTSQSMMEKVEVSKQTWDRLISCSRQDVVRLEDCDSLSSGLSVKHFDKICSSNQQVTAKHSGSSSDSLLDHNFNKAHIEMMKEPELTSQAGLDERGHIKKLVLSCDIPTNSPFCSIQHSTSQVRKICNVIQNGYTVDDQNILAEMDRRSYLAHKTSSDKDENFGKSSPHEILHKSSHFCSHSNNIKLDVTDSAVSAKFPCILHALAWATQGRDPLVKLNDPEFALPHTPRFLLEADHLQILVTGSLHLVGGVLGVVDPEMND